MWRAWQGTCGVGRATEPCRCRCLLSYRLNHSLLSMGCIDLQFYLAAHTYLVNACALFWCSAQSPRLYRCLTDSVLCLSAFFPMSQDPHYLGTALSGATWAMQWASDLHSLNAKHVVVGIPSKPAPGPPSSVQAAVTCSPHHSATPTSALHLSTTATTASSPLQPMVASTQPSSSLSTPSPIRHKWVTCPRDFSLSMCCRMTALVLDRGPREWEQLLSLWSDFLVVLMPAEQQKASVLVWSEVQIRNINISIVDKCCTTMLTPGTPTSWLNKGKPESLKIAKPFCLD